MQNIKAGTQIITLAEGVSDTTLEAAVKKFKPETDDFTIEDDGKIKTSEEPPSPSPVVEAPKLTPVSYKWTSHTSAKLTCLSNKNGVFYATWVERGAKMPAFDESMKGSAVQKDHDFNVFLSDFDSDKKIDVYIRVKDSDGKWSNPVLFQLNEDKRPKSATETPTPSRKPKTPTVDESKVTGLEKPLKFYPNTFYPFTVTGAGTDNKSPISGDVKWEPLYWSTSSNPKDSQKNTSWKIGAVNGIKDAATYNMYIFFRKWVYDGNEWQATDVVESMTVSFSSAKIEFTGTPTPTGIGGGSGSSAGVYDPEAEEKNAGGSQSKNAVSTADEAPIGTMTMLAMLSLLAGGYVLIRKRKKQMNKSSLRDRSDCLSLFI